MVIGVGSESRGDDAVGLLAARQLAHLLPQPISVLEFTGDASALMEMWRGVGQLVLIDAVRGGSRVGTITRLDVANINAIKVPNTVSSHGMGVAQAIGLAGALDSLPDSLVLYGIQGERFDMGVSMSPEVASAVDDVVRLVLKETRCMNSA